ncbi:phospholipase D-like domain-containing protein [Kutzneria kofuensis]|uniref:phospholipase D n=1 Tax=Kutzneria kofuensis TaxID=103725 RepID=A0A7W9NL88_9PSEU|nr:phospholipase D-like domain-containing protein [Kutzneria kofuensis]MBB5896196.1 phosphatidylserine/phosphatidylglycerophosphate/cardiolipin synthase-like enzyme [Kutzneria kofuensis]
MRPARMILPVVAALAALLVPGPGTPAADAAVASGAVFNNPTDPAQQYAIVNQLRSLIQTAAAGSDIRVAMYHFTDTTVAGDLLAAHDRGVNVRLVVDHSAADSAAVVRLVGGLGTDRSKSSWVTLCTDGGACIGDVGTPIMHNKFFLFSQTQGSADVVVQSSANLTVDNAEKYWNNAVTLVGNTALYNGYLSYFNDLAAQHKTGDYYRTVSAGDVKAYFFPRAGNDESTDTIYNMLSDNVTCEGNTTVGTPTGRTVIRIAMWDFTRDNIARELRALADRKCWIEIAYTGMDAGTLGYLSGHDRIKLHQIDGTYIVHSKYMLIEGTYAGERDSKWVMTGSHNYTNAALRENDEAMVRVHSNAIHDQYRANFDALMAATG